MHLPLLAPARRAEFPAALTNPPRPASGADGSPLSFTVDAIETILAARPQATHGAIVGGNSALRAGAKRAFRPSAQNEPTRVGPHGRAPRTNEPTGSHNSRPPDAAPLPRV